MYFLEGWRIVHGPGRPGATYYDENDFAMVLVLVVPFIWFLARESKHLVVRLGLFALLPVAAHAVMTTFSRGGFLGLAGTMIYIALREKNRKLGGIMIAGGVVFFLAFAGAEYRGRIHSINSYEEDRSATGRLESWEAGMRMATHNPLFGVGLKRYLNAFPYYSTYQPRVAHNSWVQLGAECGLVALACYGVLILLTIRAVRRVDARLPALKGRSRVISETVGRAVESAMVGYVVCGFFLSMEDFEGFYILVAMAQVLDRITEVRVRENAAEEGIAPAPDAAAVPV
jgi:probable O-glycosylation ligase (exosortase A-associated)